MSCTTMDSKRTENYTHTHTHLNAHLSRHRGGAKGAKKIYVIALSASQHSPTVTPLGQTIQLSRVESKELSISTMAR